MTPQTRAQLLALGTALSPPMLQGTTRLLAQLAAPADPSILLTPDHQYGPDPRNRLDVFRLGSPSGAPVLVYVHGGGFSMGDKSSPGSPFYDNVGQWAAQQGCIGVTMTYRLAPQHQWPSGPQDMALAVQWLRANIGALGGDPDAIFLMGHSAGAAHVASYLSRREFHRGSQAGIAGAVMISGIYDATTQSPSPASAAYYGEDPAALLAARCIDGLLGSQCPLLFTVSELDPREFHDQAAQLAQAWHARKGTYPPLEYLGGHNHLTPAQAIGSVEDDLGPRLLRFMAVARQP